MKKLAIVSTHPIQYYAPVFAILGQDKNLNLKVFYTWGEGSIKKHDPGFDKTIEWDVPLLEGYDYVFLENIAADPGSHHYRGIKNPGIITEIEGFNPDIVFVYGWAWQSHLSVIRHFYGKIPVWFRGDSTLMKKKSGLKGMIRSIWLNWIYRHVDHAFYAGTENKKYFLKYGLEENQLSFCPHAVDNDRFSEDRANDVAALKASFQIPSEAAIILFAGKLDDNKNVSSLITAFKELDNAGVHLLIAGDGNLRKTLEATAGSNVHFAGFVNQSAMPVFYQSCDLFCLPSLSETWGLAVNEAMAAGKAVLVSDKVGCAIDLVDPGANGIVFNLGVPGSLYQSLKDMVSDKDLLEQMGFESARIIDSYSFSVQAKIIARKVLSD